MDLSSLLWMSLLLVTCASHLYVCFPIGGPAAQQQHQRGDVGMQDDPMDKRTQAPAMRVVMEKAGNDVTLRCNAHGRPRPTIQWYKDELTMMSTRTHVVIKNVKPKHTAVYVCHAMNKHGQLNWTFVLNVTVSGGNGGLTSTELQQNPFGNQNYPRLREVIKGGSLYCWCTVEEIHQPTLRSTEHVVPPEGERHQLVLHRKHTRRKQFKGRQASSEPDDISSGNSKLFVRERQTVSRFVLKTVRESASSWLVCERKHAIDLGLGPEVNYKNDRKPDRYLYDDPEVVPWHNRTPSTKTAADMAKSEEDFPHRPSPHRVYIKGVVCAVVISLAIVLTGCFILIGMGTRKACKNEQMFFEKIDLT